MRTRRSASTFALLVLFGLTACGANSKDTEGAKAPEPPASQPPLTAAPPTESDLPPGWDQPTDVHAVPDDELDNSALTALLRTRASETAGSDRCTPTDVHVTLTGFDAALGHRYTSISVRNVSERACVVSGIPGIGARGTSGRAFPSPVEPGIGVSGSTGPVTLKPGDEARSLLEWTGELAGAEGERASLLVIQLAAGQTPIPVKAELDDRPAGVDTTLDVGMLTTLKPAAFEPAS